MTESIQPQPRATQQLRFQPSMLSVPSASATVAPETPHRPELAAPQQRGRRHLWFFVALSGLAGLVGSSALGGNKDVASHVHSGSPGYKHTKTGVDLHWKKKAVNVYLDASLTQLGPGGPEAVMQAFGQWVATDSHLPDLAFDTTTGSTPQQDGKSTVSYGRITTPGHERDLAITITYANEDTGEIVEADVILNSLYPFGVLAPKATRQAPDSDLLPSKDEHEEGKAGRPESGEAADCRNRYDAQNVTTHEAGHFFGLGEDPVASKAAMFQSIDQCELHKRTLAASDVSAIGTLYAQMGDPEEAKVGARACSFGPASSSQGPLWFSTSVLALSLLRRRRAR